MIIDALGSADRYCSLHPLFPQVFDFLQDPNTAKLAEGRYELDGDRLVAFVVRKPGKLRQEAILEGHSRAIDIHYLVVGSEAMGWRPVIDCTIVKMPYEESSDCIFLCGRTADLG